MKIIVDNKRKTKLISEIGCNHRGEFETALRMISVSSEYSDIIKFQKRNPKKLLSESEYNNPHPNSFHSYGSTYGEHREFLEFTLNQHIELKKYCEKLNRSYSCSVWDIDSAKDISSINIDIIKIPSACNLNKDLLECVFKLHSKEIHISLGMTKRDDINKMLGSNIEIRSIDVAITRIRKKIEQDQRYPAYLQTVRGIGWRLNTYNKENEK